MFAGKFPVPPGGHSGGGRTTSHGAFESKSQDPVLRLKTNGAVHDRYGKPG